MEKEQEELVEKNMGLAYKVALQYYYKVQNVYEFEDAQQVCLEGLILAAKNFDNTRGINFSTFAFTVIKRHLFRQSIVETQKRNNAFVTAICSLDSLLQDEENSLVDTIPDAFNLEDHQVNNAVIELLYKYIDELDDKYKQIMKLRCEDKTFKEIAVLLNMKENIVQQYYKKGLNMLRYKFSKYGGLDV